MLPLSDESNPERPAGRLVRHMQTVQYIGCIVRWLEWRANGPPPTLSRGCAERDYDRVRLRPARGASERACHWGIGGGPDLREWKYTRRRNWEPGCRRSPPRPAARRRTVEDTTAAYPDEWASPRQKGWRSRRGGYMSVYSVSVVGARNTGGRVLALDPDEHVATEEEGQTKVKTPGAVASQVVECRV